MTDTNNLTNAKLHRKSRPGDDIKLNIPEKSQHIWNPSVFSSILMAGSLSAHFFGYECARAASISLLSDTKGIGLGSEALTYTVAVGSPAGGMVFMVFVDSVNSIFFQGAIVLYLYARSIKLVGPLSTLRISEASCLVLMFMMLFLYNRGHLMGWIGPVSVVVYYSFREIYVSLLSTQYWSFIASILETRNSSFVVSIAGCVSVSSALGGCAVEYLVHYFGVSGLLVASFLATCTSTVCSELAYYWVHSQGDQALTEKLSHSRRSKSAKVGAEEVRKHNIWIEFWHIMYRSRTLRLLYVEAVCHQFVSNTLNLMFHDALRTGIADNAARAVAVGRFFATVNVSSCALQIFVLPSILSTSTLPQVLRTMPALILLTTVLGFLKPSITSIMIGFCTMKVLEYSIMTAAGEMIYMPMSHDDRYLGKEVVRFFGQKLGKSWSSLVLSSAMTRLRPTTSAMSLWAGCATLVWATSTTVLSSHLIAREEAMNAEKTTAGSNTVAAMDNIVVGSSNQTEPSEVDPCNTVMQSDSSTRHTLELCSCTTSESTESVPSLSSGDESEDHVGDVGLPSPDLSPKANGVTTASMSVSTGLTTGTIRKRRKNRIVEPDAKPEFIKDRKNADSNPLVEKLVNGPLAFLGFDSPFKSSQLKNKKVQQQGNFYVRIGSVVESLSQLGQGDSASSNDLTQLNTDSSLRKTSRSNSIRKLKTLKE